jgi:hypothetical protein
MTNYALLLEFMGIDRLEHADSVRVRIDSSTDIGCFLRSQTDVKGLLHDQSADDQRQGRFGRRALATGGMIYPDRRIDHGN